MVKSIKNIISNILNKITPYSFVAFTQSLYETWLLKKSTEVYLEIQ